MRYLCVSCGHKFDYPPSNGDEAAEDGASKAQEAASKGPGRPRCPKCMRLQGLEPIGANAPEGRGPWPLRAAVAVGLVAIVAGTAWWLNQTPASLSGPVPRRPLDAEELEGYLRARGADVGELKALLSADDAIERFAKSTATGPEDKAGQQIVQGLRERYKKKAFVPWSLSWPRDTRIREASATYQALKKDGARLHLYPMEIAALAVAALRSVGVDAMIAEIYSFKGSKRPADPSGQIGYYGVAVLDGGPDSEPVALLDPYGGRTNGPDKKDYRVLDDVQAAAAALNHKVLYQLVHEGNAKLALKLADVALRLDKKSPEIRSARAAVLVSSGGSQEGIQELEAAAQLRADAPRHVNLALIGMAAGDRERAQKEVSLALEQMPDFARARAALATLYLEDREVELARRELERAQSLDPELTDLPILWAKVLLAEGESELAAEKARLAIRRRPRDVGTRLAAAQVQRVAGYYDEMRRNARKALELVPAERRESLRALVVSVLGPTALEEPLGDEEDLDADELAGAPALPELPTSDLKLGSDSTLLGEPGAASGGPKLLPQDGQQGPALMLGEPGSYKLSAPGEDGFKLQLHQ